MKIAIIYDMIYPFNIGGAEIRNYEIAKRLAKKHEVHIYGVKLWKGKEVIKKDGIILHGICRYANLHNFKGKRTIWEPIWFALNLFPELLKERFDIIDTSNFVYFHCFSAKAASILTRTPLVITWHQYWGDYWYEYLGKIKGSIGRLIENLTLRLSKFNVAVSETTRNELIAHGVNDNEVLVNYNGINIEEVSQIKRGSTNYDIITVARLNHQKNIALLLSSLALLIKDLPKIKLAIIGDGPDREVLIRMTKSMNLEKNVSFLGFFKDKSDVYKTMKSSKLFVLPSILEGFGMVIIEANACGIPAMVVNSKWNASLELVKDERLIAENNAQSLALKMKQLLNNPHEIKSLGLEARNRAEKFDWGNIVKSLEEHYEKIAKNRN